LRQEEEVQEKSECGGKLWQLENRGWSELSVKKEKKKI